MSGKITLEELTQSLKSILDSVTKLFRNGVNNLTTESTHLEKDGTKQGTVGSHGKFMHISSAYGLDLHLEAGYSAKGIYLRENGNIEPQYSFNTDLGRLDSPFRDIYLNHVNRNDSGYTKLPNGLTMQWITLGEQDSYHDGWFNFPVAFPNKCITVWGNVNAMDNNTNARDPNCYFERVNNTTCHVRWGVEHARVSSVHILALGF